MSNWEAWLRAVASHLPSESDVAGVSADAVEEHEDTTAAMLDDLVAEVLPGIADEFHRRKPRLDQLRTGGRVLGRLQLRLVQRHQCIALA